MAKRTYDRLPIEEFGRHLIATGDLDPVYIALQRTKWKLDVKYRWLLAYWCFYHAGVASFMAEREGDDYWAAMLVAAANDVAAPHGGRWERASERRHFRGQQAIRAVDELREQYPVPESMALYCIGPNRSCSFAEVARRVKEHRGFGSWIAFKVGDMIDRCTEVKVNFDRAAIFMFKDPAKAAVMLHDRTLPSHRALNNLEKINVIVEALRREFAGLKAPPTGDRRVDLQEIETVLCKWKSHMNGHYPLYNDIDEINSGLEPWVAHSALARQFRDAMPKRKR